MSPTAASPRDPLILRLLLQLIRPQRLRIAVHRRIALLTVVPYCYVLWGRAYFTTWYVFVGGSLLVYTVAILFTNLTNYLTERAYHRYPEPQQAGRRLRMLGLTVGILGALTTVGTLGAFQAVHLFGYRYNAATGPWVLLSAVVFDLLLVGFFEITYAFTQWQTNQLETEQLAQQLQSQVHELKQQVNPHFLFNSLSSLSVLISEDPRQAERFVDELAQVYRYQLQAARSSQLPAVAGLVPLEAELRFLHAYAYLLGIRYGVGLQVHLPAVEACPPGVLPPLALQTLVDNAIRHNALTASRPLRIDVVLEAGCVRVQNTRHPRTVRVPISSEGLASLRARYQQLARASPRIEADDEQFTVTLPLLASG